MLVDNVYMFFVRYVIAYSSILFLHFWKTCHPPTRNAMCPPETPPARSALRLRQRESDPERLNENVRHQQSLIIWIDILGHTGSIYIIIYIYVYLYYIYIILYYIIYYIILYYIISYHIYIYYIILYYIILYYTILYYIIYYIILYYIMYIYILYYNIYIYIYILWLYCSEYHTVN